MSIINKKDKKSVQQADERQQLELYKIEHVSYWITFVVLVVVVIIESALQVPYEEMGAEIVALIVACVSLAIGCMVKGVWSFRRNKVPGVKTYLLYSVWALVIGLIFGTITVLQFGIDEFSVVLTILAIDGIMLYIICFVVFLIIGKITAFRAKKLEEQAMAELEEDDDEEEIEEDAK